MLRPKAGQDCPLTNSIISKIIKIIKKVLVFFMFFLFFFVFFCVFLCFWELLVVLVLHAHSVLVPVMISQLSTPSALVTVINQL